MMKIVKPIDDIITNLPEDQPVERNPREISIDVVLEVDHSIDRNNRIVVRLRKDLAVTSLAEKVKVEVAQKLVGAEVIRRTVVMITI